MNKSVKQVLLFAAGFVVVFGVVFIYNKVVAPRPDEDELQSCLEVAEKQETEELKEEVRNVCLRTY